MWSWARKRDPDMPSIVLSAAYAERKCRDTVIVCYVSSAVCCVPRFFFQIAFKISLSEAPLLSVDAVCIGSPFHCLSYLNEVDRSLVFSWVCAHFEWSHIFFFFEVSWLLNNSLSLINWDNWLLHSVFLKSCVTLTKLHPISLSVSGFFFHEWGRLIWVSS